MVDLRCQRAPQRGERGHSHDGRDHQPGEEPGKAQNDPPADRIEATHGATCVTSWPACTTPMTTGLAGTSPRASKAIVPVTPS